MDEITKEFGNLAIWHGTDMPLYKPEDAIHVIEKCRELRKEIFTIEAFKVFGPNIQPFMEHTIDFPDTFTGDVYQSAIDHMKKYINTGFVFDVMYIE